MERKDNWFIKSLKKLGIRYSYSGDTIMIPCPYHEEKTPGGMGVNLEKNRFHCFGCHKKGLVVDLYLKLTGEEKYSESDQIEDLEDGKYIEEDIRISGLIEKIKEIKLGKTGLKIKVLKNFNLYDYLIPYGEYLNYLRKRKINKQSISKFSIKCGLWKGDKRIIIPMRSQEGKLISIYGRSITTDIQSEKVRKSKKSDTGKILFGMYEMLGYGLFNTWKNPYLVLVEGEIDAIYLQQFGISAVSIGSKKPTINQLKLMNKLHIKDFYLALDGDVDNVEYSKIISYLEEYLDGRVEKLMLPPSKKDANSLSEDEVYHYYINKIRQ